METRVGYRVRQAVLAAGANQCAVERADERGYVLVTVGGGEDQRIGLAIFRTLPIVLGTCGEVEVDIDGRKVRFSRRQTGPEYVVVEEGEVLGVEVGEQIGVTGGGAPIFLPPGSENIGTKALLAAALDALAGIEWSSGSSPSADVLTGIGVRAKGIPTRAKAAGFNPPSFSFTSPASSTPGPADIGSESESQTGARP